MGKTIFLSEKTRPTSRLDNPVGKVYYKRRKAPAGAVEREAALPKIPPPVKEAVCRNIGTQYVQPEKLEQDGDCGGHASVR